MRTCVRDIRFPLSWAAAIISLLAAGALYRHEAADMESAGKNPVRLSMPLRTLPFVVNQWSGRDIPISQAVESAAANDDFISRLYVNNSTGQWVQVYVGFSGRPRTMVGHKPSVCYVSAGWVLDSSEQSQIFCRDGRKIPCLIHRFNRPDSSHNAIIVLNFYILNGQPSNDESAFSGIGWRTPNIEGDAARYVAQIQISSALETSVLAAATDLSEELLAFFPDKNTVSQRAQYVRGIGAVKE